MPDLKQATPDMGDKAGKLYWDQVWQGSPIPRPIDPQQMSFWRHVDRGYHNYFVQAFKDQNPQGKRLLEIGCARSRWLPYFAKEFGLRVTGLDYSETGCEQSRAILANAGVPGEVVCSDFRTPPPEMISAFDYLVSFGVVEHFADTAACLTSLGQFLKPGGTMLTFIPNMVGLVGRLQRTLSRSIYDVHVPLSREALATAHTNAGLNVKSCNYFLSINLGVVGISTWRNRYLRWLGSASLVGISRSLWVLERAGIGFRPNSFTSPYIVCEAVQP